VEIQVLVEGEPVVEARLLGTRCVLRPGPFDRILDDSVPLIRPRPLIRPQDGEEDVPQGSLAGSHWGRADEKLAWPALSKLTLSSASVRP